MVPQVDRPAGDDRGGERRDEPRAGRIPLRPIHLHAERGEQFLHLGLQRRRHAAVEAAAEHLDAGPERRALVGLEMRPCQLEGNQFEHGERFGQEFLRERALEIEFPAVFSLLREREMVDRIAARRQEFAVASQRPRRQPGKPEPVAKGVDQDVVGKRQMGVGKDLEQRVNAQKLFMSRKLPCHAAVPEGLVLLTKKA